MTVAIAKSAIDLDDARCRCDDPVLRETLGLPKEGEIEMPGA